MFDGMNKTKCWLDLFTEGQSKSTQLTIIKTHCNLQVVKVNCPKRQITKKHTWDHRELLINIYSKKMGRRSVFLEGKWNLDLVNIRSHGSIFIFMISALSIISLFLIRLHPLVKKETYTVCNKICDTFFILRPSFIGDCRFNFPGLVKTLSQNETSVPYVVTYNKPRFCKGYDFFIGILIFPRFFTPFFLNFRLFLNFRSLLITHSVSFNYFDDNSASLVDQKYNFARIIPSYLFRQNLRMWLWITRC